MLHGYWNDFFVSHTFSIAQQREVKQTDRANKTTSCKLIHNAIIQLFYNEMVRKRNFARSRCIAELLKIISAWERSDEKTHHTLLDITLRCLCGVQQMRFLPDLSCLKDFMFENDSFEKMWANVFFFSTFRIVQVDAQRVFLLRFFACNAILWRFRYAKVRLSTLPMSSLNAMS